MTRPQLEVAEVFRQYVETFLERYGGVLSSEQRRRPEGDCRLSDRGDGWSC